jgi:hypothetical protein
MNRRQVRITAAAALSLIALIAAARASGGQTPNIQVPIFEYDPTFPKPLPENWAIGPISGLAVDRQDHLFVVQWPGGLLTNERLSGANANPPKAECCIAQHGELRRRGRAVVPAYARAGDP